MTHIAFFGHNSNDAAVRRRAVSFLKAGFALTGFMPHRGEPKPLDWTNVDLGESRDFDYKARVMSIFTGGRQAARDPAFAEADLIYARNLDMLACAFLAKRHLGLDTPVIYECLDVHRLLVRGDPIGWAMRQLEKRLLRRCRALVISSPAFLREHFEPRYGLDIPVHLIENRMVDGMAYGARPRAAVSPHQSGPLRLGWFGILRCSRSLDLLIAVADAMGDKVSLTLRGRVSKREIPDFETRIASCPNISFGGEFKAPEDLAEIYGSVDLVWAGDFMEAGFNSVWLLPNRLYEGGYFGVPPIAPAGTETANWIADHQCGFQVAEPLHLTLPELITRLNAARHEVTTKSEALLSLPESVFIQPAGSMTEIIHKALEAKR